MRANETTTYRWDDPKSIIQRVDVRQQSNGWAVAYLYANPDPDLKNERLNVRAALRLKGWGTLSDHRNGEFGLRVTGLRSGEDLIALLQSEHLVGVPHDQKTKRDTPADMPTTLWGKIRANSLQWSGVLATLGNAIVASAGVYRNIKTNSKEYGAIGKGLAFGVADLPLMIAGGHDDARQLNNFLRQLKTHYDKEGIEIPRTASIYVETSDRSKGMGELTKDYLHRYANQIKCFMEVVAAGFSIKAGKEQKLWPKRYAPFLWGPGFLASLLIPEKKIDEEKYEQAGTLSRLWMRIQSNPLAIGGTLGYTNTAADFYSAHIGREQWKAAGSKGPKFYQWDAAAPSVMIGANGLYAISKKTVGGDIKNDSLVNDAYIIAAQIINKQPEALREKAIESTAKFFGDRVEIPEHHAEAVRRLRQEVAVQRQNPWFEPLGLAPYVPTPKRGPSRHADEVAAAHIPAPEHALSDNLPSANENVPVNVVHANGLEHAQQPSAHNPEIVAQR